MFHPDKVKAPIFIYQDARDRRANISELEHYVREVQRRNVQVKYILNKNARGSSANENSRMHMYAEIEKFLMSNMKVKP